jgi:hypothetical protein
VGHAQTAKDANRFVSTLSLSVQSNKGGSPCWPGRCCGWWSWPPAGGARGRCHQPLMVSHCRLQLHTAPQGSCAAEAATPPLPPSLSARRVPCRCSLRRDGAPVTVHQSNRLPTGHRIPPGAQFSPRGCPQQRSWRSEQPAFCSRYTCKLLPREWRPARQSLLPKSPARRGLSQRLWSSDVAGCGWRMWVNGACGWDRV